MDELIFASATSLTKAIREKKISSEEIVSAYLKRINEVNPKINAVVALRADGALEDARKADAGLARGKIRGPLHGLPITLKDNYETTDLPCTGGTLGRAGYIAPEDNALVKLARAAGAIVLGKTNMPEFAVAYESDNLVYGRTNNPYDLERVPGGSSGGEAAILAAGGSPLGLGTDTGGSLRIPAHFCGIASIKSTSGRLPKTGHFPPYAGVRSAMSQNGPMARFVEDLILTLPLLAASDGRDPAFVPMPLGHPTAVNLKKLRAAYHTDNGLMTPTPETISTIQNAAQALKDAGALVTEALPDCIRQTADLFLPLFSADGGTGIKAGLERVGTKEYSPIMINYLEELRNMKSLTTAEFMALTVQWDIFKSRMLAFMQGYDVMICPTAAVPAVPHTHTYTVYGALQNGESAFSYVHTYNLTGWPCVIVRGGTSPEGLPIGVQVVAAPWREDIALAAAWQIEKALGGWQRPPL